MVELISRINDSVNSVVWGVPALILLIGTGVVMTVVTKFFQFTHFGHIMKETVGSRSRLELLRNKGLGVFIRNKINRCIQNSILNRYSCRLNTQCRSCNKPFGYIQRTYGYSEPYRRAFSFRYGNGNNKQLCKQKAQKRQSCYKGRAYAFSLPFNTEGAR